MLAFQANGRESPSIFRLNIKYRMSQPDVKQELLEALRDLSDAAPGMRIGQLMAGAGEICSSMHGRGLWDAEDRELLEAVWKFQKDIETNLPAEVHPNA